MSNNNDLLLQHLESLDQDIRELRSEMQRELTVLRTNIKVDMNEIHSDVKDLNAFRFRVYGIASFLSAVIGYLVTYFKE